jgi:hypothetical protein
MDAIKRLSEVWNRIENATDAEVFGIEALVLLLKPTGSDLAILQVAIAASRVSDPRGDLEGRVREVVRWMPPGELRDLAKRYVPPIND